MQVIYVVLAVVYLGYDLLRSKEGKVSHLKLLLALHVVDSLDRFPDLDLQLHQICDAGVDLCLKLYDGHHRLLNRRLLFRRRNLGFIRDLRRNIKVKPSFAQCW